MDKVRHSAGIWTSRAQHVTCNTCSVCRKHGCLRAASAQWPTLIPAVSQLNPQHIVLPASNPRTLSCSGPAGDQGSAQTPTQEPLTFNPKTCTRERPSTHLPVKHSELLQLLQAHRLVRLQPVRPPLVLLGPVHVPGLQTHDETLHSWTRALSDFLTAARLFRVTPAALPVCCFQVPGM